MTVVLVVGAGRAIALSICNQFHDCGDRVVAACVAEGTELLSKHQAYVDAQSEQTC
jgi:NAD(P)-dependent dehydrogenase (short-subunit alcohol dehydrogenase family)